MSTATSQRRIYGLSVSARLSCSDPVPIASPRTRRLLRTTERNRRTTPRTGRAREARVLAIECTELSPRREARLLDQRCRSPRSDRLAQHLRRGDPWFHPHRGTSARVCPRYPPNAPSRHRASLLRTLQRLARPQARAVSGATVNRTKT